MINSNNVRVSECLICEHEPFSGMLTGIELTGSCPGTIVKDNSISRGKKGDILNESSGVIIDANISVSKKAGM